MNARLVVRTAQRSLHSECQHHTAELQKPRDAVSAAVGLAAGEYADVFGGQEYIRRLGHKEQGAEEHGEKMERALKQAARGSRHARACRAAWPPGAAA